MELPIYTFLVRLDEHLSQFDEEVYPEVISTLLRTYCERTKNAGDLADNLSHEAKRYLEEAWMGNLKRPGRKHRKTERISEPKDEDFSA